MHLLTDRIILSELMKLRIVRGDLEEMLTCRISALFMPHGLGHLVGLDAFDVGGYPKVVVV